MYDFPWEPAIAATRALVKNSFMIPDGNPIAESGNNWLNIPAFDSVPMALIEMEGECSIEEGVEGFASKDLVNQWKAYLWLIQATTGGVDDRKLMEQALETLELNLYEDRTLSGTLTNLEVIELDVSGQGRDFPGSELPGSGLQYGYLGIRSTIADQ